MSENGETRITSHTVRPLYTYWTLGYILTYRGAQKLLEVDPLKNLIPVDEFLPIMFDTHPKYVRVIELMLSDKSEKAIIVVRIYLYVTVI